MRAVPEVKKRQDPKQPSPSNRTAGVWITKHLLLMYLLEERVACMVANTTPLLRNITLRVWTVTSW